MQNRRLDTTAMFMVVVTSLFNLCMNMAVDLSWWFQQRRSSLFVHQATNSLFQHARTTLSITMFKLASSTMFKPVNRQKHAGRFYVCRGKGELWSIFSAESWRRKYGDWILIKCQSFPFLFATEFSKDLLHMTSRTPCWGERVEQLQSSEYDLHSEL